MVDGWAESQVEMDPLWNWPHGEAGMILTLMITRRLSYVKQQVTQESVLLELPVNYKHYNDISTYYVICFL